MSYDGKYYFDTPSKKPSGTTTTAKPSKTTKKPTKKPSFTKAIKGEVLTEIPNLPCSYTSQFKEIWHFRNKTFF